MMIIDKKYTCFNIYNDSDRKNIMVFELLLKIIILFYYSFGLSKI